VKSRRCIQNAHTSVRLNVIGVPHDGQVSFEKSVVG
jgi:hypothetical protein